MEVQGTPGVVKRIRRACGHFQRTFLNSGGRSTEFAAAFLGPHLPLKRARIAVDAVIFTPRRITALLAHHGHAVDLRRDWTIAVDRPVEISDLLEAALSDGLEFYFVPEPRRIVLYSDHDDFATVFGTTKGAVSRTATSLSAAGFEEVRSYHRTF